LPFKKPLKNTWELVLFFHNILNWAPLGICGSIFDDRKSHVENGGGKSEFRNGRYNVSLTVPNVLIN
jgi:hypothetical protein